MKHELFISYSRVDSAFAVRLVRDLKHLGLEAWLDQLDIPTGVNWDNEIEKALDHAETVIVILSESSAKSENVKNEISAAIERSKHVVPITLGKCNVPLIINRLQREDFTGDYDAALKKLLRRLSGGNRTSSLRAITEGDVARMAKEAAARLGVPADAPVPPDSLSPATVRHSEPVVPVKHTHRTVLAAIGGAVITAGIALAFTLARDAPRPEPIEPAPIVEPDSVPPFDDAPPVIPPDPAPDPGPKKVDPPKPPPDDGERKKRPRPKPDPYPVVDPVVPPPPEPAPDPTPEPEPTARPHAILCEEAYYGGRCIKAVTRPTMYKHPLGNDTVSSVRLGTCSAVIVCAHDNLEPPCATLTQDEEYLGNTAVGNDGLSSLKCVGPSERAE